MISSLFGFSTGRASRGVGLRVFILASVSLLEGRRHFITFLGRGPVTFVLGILIALSGRF